MGGLLSRNIGYIGLVGLGKVFWSERGEAKLESKKVGMSPRG